MFINYMAYISFAQQKINAQLKVAESRRLARPTHGDRKILATAGRAYGWVGRVSSQLTHSLETLGEYRVALFQR
jgi:hypothetical protein